MSVNMNRFNLEKIEHVQEPSYNLIEVHPSQKINDIRKSIDFKKTIIGGFSKTESLSTLTKSIETEQIEKAVYLGLLLFFSGSINQLWNKLIIIAAKNINISNPKLPKFLANRHIQWNKLITEYIGSTSKVDKSNVFLKLRNSCELRNYLCEMIGYLCLSRKVKIDTIPKIKESEFEISNFKKHLEAKDTSYSKNITKENDPSEITIVCNEFAYHLKNRNTNKSLYWLSWMMAWDKINSKKYGKFEVHDRPIDSINSKYSKDIVWLIWEVINDIRNSNFNDTINEQIDSLFKLYCFDFTSGKKSSKLIIIEWAIKYLTNIIDWKIPLIDRKYLLYQIINNMEVIVLDVKKEENTGNIYKNEMFNMNIIDNYMLTQNHKDLEEKLAYDKRKKEEEQKKKYAKKHKISLQSLNKLELLKSFNG